jgi:hypothetical protein
MNPKVHGMEEIQLKYLTKCKKKRFIIFLAVIAVVLLAAGCGSSETESKPPVEKAAEPTSDSNTTTEETAAPVNNAPSSESAAANNDTAAESGEPNQNDGKSSDLAAAEDPSKNNETAAKDNTTAGTSGPSQDDGSKQTDSGEKAGSPSVSMTSWSSVAETVGETAPKLDGYVIYGRVTDESGQPLTKGVVALEQGKVHNDNFKYGGVIYPDGTYAIKVRDSGDYGVHIYVDGYIYQPGQVNLGGTSGKQAEFNASLVEQPQDMNAPTVSNPQVFDLKGDKVRITLEAMDNKEDLSPQVLAVNINTGQALRLEPPTKPLPEIAGKRFAVYPNGTYSLEIPPKSGKGRWIFVAANHRCAISDLIRLSSN